MFAKSDLRAIAALIERESEQRAGAGYKAVSEFEIVSDDGTSYKSDVSAELFADGSPIDTKRTTSVSIGFRAWLENPFRSALVIRLSLTHGSRVDNLTVSGDDANWVGGAFARLKEAIDAARPQDNFLLRHRTIAFHVVAVVAGFAISPVFNFAFTLLGLPDEIQAPPAWAVAVQGYLLAHRGVVIAIRVLAAWMQGVWAALWASQWVDQLWPSIELDVGPGHLRLERARRRRLAFLAGAVLLPLALRAVYDLVKLGLGRT